MISDTILDKTIGINPISAYRAFIRWLNSKLKDVDDALTKQRASRNETIKLRDQYKAEMNEALSHANAAQRLGPQHAAAFQTATAKAARRKGQLAKFENAIAFSTQMIATLERARDVITFKRDDALDAIEVMKTDRDWAITTLEAASAGQEAADAINGTSSKAEIARRANEIVRSQVADAQAQVEQLMVSLAPAGTEMDLTNMANSIEGETMLREWQESLGALEHGPSLKQIGAPTPDFAPQATESNNYAKLFRR
jgi:chromosome segregation ATPase